MTTDAPETSSTAGSTAAADRRGRIKLAALLLVPVLVMGFAYTLFFSGWVPDGTSNKGDLIRPPVQLQSLKSLSDASFWGEGNTRWGFLVLGGSDCDDACTQRLYLSRQIRTALGKRTPRIQRFYLNDGQQALSPELQTLLKDEHGDLKLLGASKDELSKLLATSKPALALTDSAFFIVDPRGFVMMRYTDAHSYKDTMTDMKFLLKYSPE